MHRSNFYRFDLTALGFEETHKEQLRGLYGRAITRKGFFFTFKISSARRRNKTFFCDDFYKNSDKKQYISDDD
jgi:hypothetical protein